MALRDTLRNLIGIPDNDYDSDFDDDMQSGNVEQEEEEQQMPASAPSTDHRHNKVVNIHATTQLKVVLVKPERFENASEIADHLKEKRTVVLNLESANKDVARRTFAGLRELRDELEAAYPDLELPELSCGMSEDFEPALEEGSTLVRLGRVVFSPEFAVK